MTLLDVIDCHIFVNVTFYSREWTHFDISPLWYVQIRFYFEYLEVFRWNGHFYPITLNRTDEIRFLGPYENEKKFELRHTHTNVQLTFSFVVSFFHYFTTYARVVDFFLFFWSFVQFPCVINYWRTRFFVSAFWTYTNTACVYKFISPLLSLLYWPSLASHSVVRVVFPSIFFLDCLVFENLRICYFTTFTTLLVKFSFI